MSNKQIPLSRFSNKGSQLPLQPAQAWIAILGFILFSGLCLLAGVGRILYFAFPLGAFAVGVFLYLRYPVLYLGFTWWIWFLTPWVRRLVDYKSGYVEPSPLLLAPFMVTSVTTATFMRYLPASYRSGGLPFVLAGVGVFYSLLIGLIKSSPTALVVPLLEWMTPILLGFHLFTNWQEYPGYCQNIQRTFLWGTLVTGAYGVVQFLVAPEWDKSWLINSEATAFGSPEPLGIRVFSTMNSPGPFAVVMMAGLLLLFSRQRALGVPTAGVGYLAFLLSQVRSAWLGWFTGLLTLIPFLKPQLQMRLIITLIAVAVLILPLISMDQFSDTISSRLQTLSSVQEDGSYEARMAAYAQVLTLALSKILGEGLGYVIDIYGFGSDDSGILMMLFSLGWLGTIPYMSGIILLLYSLFQGFTERSDPFIGAARAISVGVLVQIGFGSVMIALSGVVLWGFAGIAMAGQKYYWHQKITELRKV